MTRQKISIRGAREHFLKNINLDLPLHELIVVTGVSGSGKSSLVVDTLYQEGRRRYLDFVSEDMRGWIGDISKPDVDSIEGLPPVFLAGQDRSKINKRSTVGTLVEVQDLLRLLFSRIGDIFCYHCQKKLKRYTSHEIVNELLSQFENESFLVLAPVASETSLDRWRKEGFVRARIDGRNFDLNEPEIPTGKDVEIVVDRILIKRQERARLTESVEMALKYGSGVVHFFSENLSKNLFFSNDYRCLDCQLLFGNLPPSSFSFNSPYGACERCHGLGLMTANSKATMPTWQYRSSKISIKGTESEKVCSMCDGKRLNPEALAVRLGDCNIFELGEKNIQSLLIFFKEFKPGGEFQFKIWKEISKKIIERLNLLIEMGLAYLSLNRRATTLSSGELQRVRLTSHMASGLVEVVYILDEPTLGLHPREINLLLKILFKVRDQGNTVIVIEHDETVIRCADKIVELGVGAGPDGGMIVVEGSINNILACPQSLTRRLLRNSIEMGMSQQEVKPKVFLEIQGACVNNLKSINVQIPLGVFCCITGVSGSGKSSLVYDVVVKLLNPKIKSSEKKKLCKGIQGQEQIDQCIVVDAIEMGRSPRSITATYSNVFDEIRELFTKGSESRMRGYTKDRFSFNVKGGRCEACLGQGIRQVEMTFLPDFEMSCDVCLGERYNPETLEVKFKGKNIAEVLKMTVQEAVDFFKNIPGVSRKLEPLIELGLGYLALGQSAFSFSGGEAQRLKLAVFLAKQTKRHTLFVFDEPTRGLHLADIASLMKILFRLRDEGHSVLVIEHHLAVIEQADHVIDLGPGAGEEGGTIIAQGSPQAIAQEKKSITGSFLKSRWQALRKT